MIRHLFLTCVTGLAFGASSVAAAAVKAPASGTVVCHQSDISNGTYQFTKLTISYDLTPIASYDDDLHASVAGTFDLDACYWQSQGSLNGTLTPKIWYGGAFDVSLALKDTNGADRPVRVLLLRSTAQAYIWMKSDGEPTSLDCQGTP